MPWLFGYGSIIWRPNLEYIRSSPALLSGWGRSFNQKSYDHRGTPIKPGRVLTLRQNLVHECHGVAFEISGEHWAETLKYLDHREKGGYTRTSVQFELDGTRIQGVSYIAHPGNPHDAGDETLEQIVSVIRVAEGPSGTNREYLLALMSALERRQISDPYLSAVLAAYRAFVP